MRACVWPPPWSALILRVVPCPVVPFRAVPCHAEHDKRKDELEKIISLDKKINVELTTLKERMRVMQAEMAAFKTEDQLQEESNQAKKGLLKEKQATKKVREAIKLHVQQLSHAFEKKKRVRFSAFPTVPCLLEALHAACVVPTLIL